MNISETNYILQSVFDSAPNGIAVLKPVLNDHGKAEDFTVMLMNRYMLALIGADDFKEKKLTDLIPGIKDHETLQRIRATGDSGVTLDFHASSVFNGRTYRCRYTSVKFNDLVILTAEDITDAEEDKEALSKALAVAEQKKSVYESITATTPDLVYIFDPSYRFTYANKALLDMWGKTADEAIGKGLRENGYEEWHALMHEREIDEVVNEKKMIRGTVSFPHAELGSRIYDYIFGPHLNEKGEVEAIAGITRDITELKYTELKLKESEARLKSVIDQTPAATLVLRGDDLVIEQINAPMIGLIGRGDDVIGKPLIAVLPELKGQYVWEQVQNVYLKGTPFYQSEVHVPHQRNGVPGDYYYNLAYRPLIENEKITGMIQVAIDVTEQVIARKKVEESENNYRLLSETLEQQVEKRTEELQRSNSDLQQFAHVASHDLKEPVRKIETFINRLEKNIGDSLDEESSRFLERIHVATNRMITMIDGVLAYSATNAGTQKLEAVDLNETVSNIETDLELALQKKHGVIKKGNLPVLHGAPVLLYQLFYNLINNSIKFSKADEPLEINISCEMSPEKTGAFYRITVKDNGIGFEPQYADHIFETFTRLNSKDKFEGTGLGLSLCKKIAERHGGSITAAGSPNEGATFVVTLPLKQEKENI